MKRVVIESPFAGDRERNAEYLRRAALDSLARGEAPYASHVIYTQWLDDDIPQERQLGIDAGIVWGEAAELVAVYEDYGISRGMAYGIEAAEKRGTPVERRRIGENP